MSSVVGNKKLVTYLANGQAVCLHHFLRCCGICYVDFTFDSHNMSDCSKDDECQHDSNGGPTATGLVLQDNNSGPVLHGPDVRFIPPRDAQVVVQVPRPANTYMSPRDWDDHPPTTPLPSTALTAYSCRDCHLTWLGGDADFHAASIHPSHHTYHHDCNRISRSLLVWVDGACTSNGLPNAQAGIGVYFGPDSPYNLSERLQLLAAVTNQKAELEAVICALNTIRSRVIPDHWEICQRTPGTRSVVQDAVHLRVVIVTDSSYVVEGMCQHYSNWAIKDGHLTNKQGKVVANSNAFQRLRHAAKALSIVGVQVVYYHVRREYNWEADTLAKNAIYR